MSESIHRAVIAACRNILLPIARFVLRHGVSFQEFSDAAKSAFVQVAAKDHGTDNREANISTIAAVTGLSRKEIKKIRDIREPTSHHYLVPLAEVLNEWSSNLRYLNSAGMPIDLPLSADNRPCFLNITRNLSKDVPHMTILRELKKAGCIRELDGGKLRLVEKHYLPGGQQVGAIHHFEKVMYLLGSTLVHNQLSRQNNSNFFERTSFTYGMKPLSVPTFLRLSKSSAESFLEMIDNWLTENEDKSKKVTGEYITGIGVFSFHHRNVFSHVDLYDLETSTPPDRRGT